MDIDALTAAARELTEDQATDLIHALFRQHQITGMYWSMGDVLIESDGEEWYSGDGGEELTPAERVAVASTWEWRKGIVDTAAERVADLIPRVERHQDGSFTVSSDLDATTYRADGTPWEGAASL